MSHLRRAVALIILALMGWFVAVGAIGAVTASASVIANHNEIAPPILCC